MSYLRKASNAGARTLLGSVMAVGIAGCGYVTLYILGLIVQAGGDGFWTEYWSVLAGALALIWGGLAAAVVGAVLAMAYRLGALVLDNKSESM